MAVNIANRYPASLGEGVAIVGVRLGWVLAMKYIMMPVLQMVESGSAALVVVGITVLVLVYILAFVLVYTTTSAILDRWGKE